jgi:glutamine amidotransferase
LANGRDLFAFRFAVNDASNSLYYRADAGGSVVVSEPLDDNHDDWISVTPNHMLIARAGAAPQLLPFLQG